MNFIPRPKEKRNKGSKEILNQSEVSIQTKKTNNNRENRKNRNRIIQKVKWVLGLDFCTARYLIYKELNIEKMKGRWAVRAWKFESNIGNEDENRLTRICWNEKRISGKVDQYMLEKGIYLKSLGLSTMAIESMKYEEDAYEEVLLKKEKDEQGQLIANKIDKSRYNERYKQIMIIGKTEYLTKECRNYKEIARMRCGN